MLLTTVLVEGRGYATQDADLVVIGSGPGGYVGAIKEHNSSIFHCLVMLII